MKKLLLTMLIASGLIFTSNYTVEACGQCQGSAQNKCKISALKNQVKTLWLHKDYLELSDEQIDQLKDIKHAAIKDLIRTKADIDIVKVDLKSAIWSETIDTSAVNKLIDQKYSAKNKMAKRYVKAKADIQKVLNKDQNKKARDMAMKIKISGSCSSSCSACVSSGGGVCPYSKGKGSGFGAKGSMR